MRVWRNRVGTVLVLLVVGLGIAWWARRDTSDPEGPPVRTCMAALSQREAVLAHRDSASVYDTGADRTVVTVNGGWEVRGSFTADDGRRGRYACTVHTLSNGSLQPSVVIDSG